MPKFTEAVAKRTGRKQRIPVAWLDHPVLGEGFRESPRTTARKAEKRTAKQAASNKAEPSTATAADTIDAPAAGDKE